MLRTNSSTSCHEAEMKPVSQAPWTGCVGVTSTRIERFRSASVGVPSAGVSGVAGDNQCYRDLPIGFDDTGAREGAILEGGDTVEPLESVRSSV